VRTMAKLSSSLQPLPAPVHARTRDCASKLRPVGQSESALYEGWKATLSRPDAHAGYTELCSLKVDHADAMWQHGLGTLPTAPSGDETIALRRPL
jgi:hypothetical protein